MTHEPSTDELRPGSSGRVRIRDLAHGGAGVGNAEGDTRDGIVWFVEGALPGELVEAVVDHRAKKFLRAHATQVIEPAAIRVSPACPYADLCGGCAWQHVACGAQAELKRDIVRAQLRAIEIPEIDVIGSPQPLGYRRRARVHYEKHGTELRLGFRGRRSRSIANMAACAVLEPALDRAVQRVRAMTDLLPSSGAVHGITDGVRVLLGLPAVPVNAETLAAAEALLDDTLVGVELRGGRQRHVVGKPALDIDAGDGRRGLTVGPFGFAQAQAAQNAALVRHVARQVGSGGEGLELFAGAGNLTRVLGRAFKSLECVEHEREAVEQLRRLKKRDSLPLHVLRSKADVAVRRFAERKRKFRVSVLDPPRGGLGEEGTRDLCRVTTQGLVYVSCDPATLARDLRVATASGFRVSGVTVFDFMPMTPEVEIVVALERPPRGTTRP
ncbi:MAG: TRAM domain-containing protein [Nannocystaceae bacterium]